MSEKWEIVEDDYHKRLRLVEYPSGRIVGTVSGCIYNPRDSWFASREGKALGDYVTEGLAKKAVELARKPPAEED